MCTYLYYIQEISDQNWEGFKQNSAYFKHYISFFPPLKFVVGDWENKVTCYREVLLQQIMKVLSPFYYVAATNIFFSPLSSLSFLFLPSSPVCVEPRCLTLDCPLSSSFLPRPCVWSFGTRCSPVHFPLPLSLVREEPQHLAWWLPDMAGSCPRPCGGPLLGWARA